MHFLLLGWDAEDSQERRPAVRPDHLAHWKEWDDAGRILIGGAMADFAGSMLVVEAETIEEAQKKLESDPYVKAGVFERIEVHPLKAVLPRKVYGK